MKLKRFRIKNYKVIDDTDWIPVDGRVTALVGKNESGKTAILRSLWKSKNVANAKFDKLLDYPRDRYAEERKGSQEVVALEFELATGEGDELAAQFPFEVTRPKKVVFTTYYEGEDSTDAEVTFEDKLEKLCGTSSADARTVVEATANALVAAADEGDTSIGDAHVAALDKIREDALLWDAETVAALGTFDSTVSKWVKADESREPLAKKERKALADALAKAKRGDPSTKAREWVTENMPSFIYFDDYGQLETRLRLSTYLGRLSSPDPKTRTQTALLAWSNLDPKEILELGRPRAQDEKDEQVQRRLDKRGALLESASFGLTGDWIKWWTEKEHQLHFSADGEDLVLKVSDENNPFRIPFEERSRGLQWFFSFYLVFLVESEPAHKGAILLLDEPGLHLHPALQSKLIELFERMATKNQLIYSTHLPFLVDGNHLERVRTMHLSGDKPQKAVVSNDIRPAGDRDTLFPLQAAVGYSIAQTLFLGKRSVIVEGITDYWLMKALDNCLADGGDTTCLHEDTVLIPAGGTSRMMPLASIMFGTTGVGDRQMLVLLDSDTQGLQAVKRFERELFGGDASRILMLGQALNLQKATIEDLVPRDEYASALRACGHSFQLVDAEKKADTNVAAMDQAFRRKGWKAFGQEHRATAALHLIDKWGGDPTSIPESIRKKASALFGAINRKFEGPEMPR